ncbi:DUF6503 family protein [Flavobacterium sp. ASW18X]|uniref:DUF6503 family protein n=1 Tax=Flavobacterium sp. ASW18X TaxID=2572595 RepID=UPI0010AE8C18|nr:DUF6503 family protein [Flavobacterium sp. ASW18X]TKD65863.1 deoxyribose-phosphate aldolase [Flavobacterium sp. ASW18X]
MKRILTVMFCIGLFYSCHQEEKINAQQIVDKAIAESGGILWETHKVTFQFREKMYSSDYINGKMQLTREFVSGDSIILDTKYDGKFTRTINDSIAFLADTTARKYDNSVNSVHYFAKLPYGLNDAAVNKQFLGTETINGKQYYKIQIDFDQTNGGDDFEDVYHYWIGKEDFKVDYLAYTFTVNGGGVRFRRAYNERYIGKIRFVDYENYKPRKHVKFSKIAEAFVGKELELVSKIELENIRVEQ